MENKFKDKVTTESSAMHENLDTPRVNETKKYNGNQLPHLA